MAENSGNCRRTGMPQWFADRLQHGEGLMHDAANLLTNLYKGQRIIPKREAAKARDVVKQNREINWYGLRASIQARQELERRVWELWGMYGHR